MEEDIAPGSRAYVVLTRRWTHANRPEATYQELPLAAWTFDGDPVDLTVSVWCDDGADPVTGQFRLYGFATEFPTVVPIEVTP